MVHKFEGGGIDAIAEVSRRGAIFKYVPEVRVTPGALHFRPPHAVTHGSFQLDVLILHRVPEARPTRAGFEFLLGMKEIGSATNAAENSIFVEIPELAGEGALGASVACHLVLLRSEDLLPFRVRFHHFFSAHPALPVIRGCKALQRGSLLPQAKASVKMPVGERFSGACLAVELT
jgi:hypothetical protein